MELEQCNSCGYTFESFKNVMLYSNYIYNMEFFNDQIYELTQFAKQSDPIHSNEITNTINEILFLKEITQKNINLIMTKIIEDLTWITGMIIINIHSNKFDIIKYCTNNNIAMHTKIPKEHPVRLIVFKQ